MSMRIRKVCNKEIPSEVKEAFPIFSASGISDGISAYV